jgi:hypothetical protein
VYQHDPTASRVVDWWAVHQFLEKFLTPDRDYPMIGTLAWQNLPDHHPAKWAAVYDAARHHALRVHVAQEARAEASHDISAAADWQSLAQEQLSRNQYRASRPWMKRTA